MILMVVVRRCRNSGRRRLPPLSMAESIVSTHVHVGSDAAAAATAACSLLLHRMNITCAPSFDGERYLCARRVLSALHAAPRHGTS
jgi:hypothetical protein